MNPGHRKAAFWIIWLLASLALPGGAQTYNYFYGRVLDAATRRGLPEVNMVLEGTGTGTVTARNGDFSFYTPGLPATLTVSRLGYATRSILLDTTSFTLTIYLAPAVTELAEVEITARKLETVFRDERYAVLDYEIDSGRLDLLVFKYYRSNAQVVCLSPSGDTLALSDPVTFRPDRLFTDCLGNLHVLGHDSGYQVFREGRRLLLIHPVRLRKFEDVLKDCVASTPDLLFFQKRTDKGLGVEYYGVDRKDSKHVSLGRVSDEARLRMLRRNAGDARMLDRKVQPDGREDFVTWNYVNKILYRPVNTALYAIGEYICIFNTPAREVEFYDGQGRYSYKLALRVDEAAEGRWTGEVLADAATGRVYTTFLRNGSCSLFQIDLNNGSLKKRITLEHSFPRKVRVWNGWAFYLYDVAGDPDNRMLFRQQF